MAKTTVTPLIFHDTIGADKALLMAGEDYVIKYRDSHTGKLKMAGAVWNGQEFVYCAARLKFVVSHTKPRFQLTQERHFILGVCRLADFAEKPENGI